MAVDKNLEDASALNQAVESIESDSVSTPVVTAEKVSKPVLKDDKKSKSQNKNNQKKKVVKKPNKVAKKTRETVSELKKVSWPRFATVLEKTSIVLAVVLIFAVILFGIELLLSFLFRLLIV